MKIGISSYALAWTIGVPGYTPPNNPLDTIGLLRKTKELGLNLVQIADNIPLHELSESELKQIKETAIELEVELEIGTRGTDTNHLYKYLELAVFFKSKLVRTIINHPNLTDAVKDIKEVLPAYMKAGVTLGIENHDRHTTNEFQQLFAEIGTTNVGVCIDTVNSFGALEGPQQVIENLAPYIVNVHFKDFKIKRLDHMMGFILNGTPAGDGMLKLEWLINALTNQEKEINIILELWPPYTNSVEETIALENEWVVKSVHYLKDSILNKEFANS